MQEGYVRGNAVQVFGSRKVGRVAHVYDDYRSCLIDSLNKIGPEWLSIDTLPQLPSEVRERWYVVILTTKKYCWIPESRLVTYERV